MVNQYAPRTGSRFVDPNLQAGGGQNYNKTGIHLSTMILISVGETPVGAIQDLAITEAREARKIAEVGTDGIVDSAPSKAADISGNCTRIRFDRLRIAEAFGRGFIHVHSQRIPFDITITDFFAGDSDDAKIITTIKNVWIRNISYTYSANDYVIVDRMDWTAEAIYSMIAAGDNNVAQGGEPNITPWSDDIERDADRGGRRGSLDAPGLLRAVLKSY
jgi:hypothetical protein